MAAGDIKIAYASRAQITITLASLASSATAGRESTYVDNATNLYDDALVTLDIVFPNSAPANHKGVYIFGYGYDGSDYGGYATGSDAAYTFDDITTTGQNLPLLKFVTMVQNKTQKCQFTVAAGFGGILPLRWGLVALNYSGQTLTSGEAYYQGIYYNVAS